MPLVDREQDVTNKTAQTATSIETASDIPDEDVAPPKPPLPEAKMAELRWGLQYSATWNVLYRLQ